ncbi:MAG: DinB family protein [Flavobacteriales bacterium]|nr:DinB family protein [Flavobacteriales bacterium]
MDRSQINTVLLKNHEAFIRRVLAVPADQRDKSHNGKWTPAQHLEHVQRAIAPVSLALLVPKWFLRWRFGKPNRVPRDYDGVVQRYKEKLAAGGRASGRFVPPNVPSSAVERISASVQRIVATMTRRAGAWSEQDLDTVLLPHPLLGKLTVREMLFFTIYHAQHHHGLLDRDYPGSD